MFKIAFLFLTITNVFNESYWRDFFAGHEHQYSILVHAKENIAPSSWFKQFQMPYKVQNSWARTMKAQIALLKEALQDPDNQIFIFCSNNTLPLQSFDFIYNEVKALNKSIFVYEPNPHADKSRNCYQAHRDLQPIAMTKQYKNSQWVILTREHAQLMVDDAKIIAIVSHYPHDQEHYPSTLLALCNKLHEVHACDKTLVVWDFCDRPPYIFNDLNKDLERNILTEAIKYGVFFVRKIEEHCNLAPIEHLLKYRQNN